MNNKLMINTEQHINENDEEEECYKIELTETSLYK